MSSKKKILILIDWFYPGYKAGGPIQSVMNLIGLLNKDFEVYILTTDTDHGDTKPYEKIKSNEWFYSDELGISLYYARVASISKNQIRKQIVHINADYIYLNHLYSPLFVIYPLWLKYVNVIKGKVVVCPRGALFESAISVKAYKKRPLLMLYRLLKIQKKILFHATNERERRAIEDYLPGSKIVVADNLPALNQPEYVSTDKRSGELKIVFISRIVPIKNLSYLLDLLSSVNATIHLTIAGPAEDEDYWKVCQKQISSLTENIHVRYSGSVQKSEIHTLIQDNHLFVLPTKGENFGHAIFESFFAGRPVLISDQTPWCKLSDFNAGWDISLDNPDKFIAIIEKMANVNKNEFDFYAKSAWDFASKFIEKSFSENSYLQLFS